jgi:hypothetical protein
VPDPLISDHTRRRIAAAAELCLKEADAIDVLPTPLEVVGEAAGLLELISMDQLPEEIAIQKPPKWKRILGAVLFRERAAFVDCGQKEPRMPSPRRTRRHT